VLDCANFSSEVMTQQRFFAHYMHARETDASGAVRMLKVKDWPPEERFAVAMVGRAAAIAVAMVSMPYYCC
jgi:hypothetical protein